ncbi:hypothetical protein BDV95DRAFT_284671 [Massariosphaeria phaeospora]|uniref:Myb-like domain-containing protein n=1 Tax=Massariosphaeria phaeospora TaxID=100035 RepID=A0A7C8MVA6_9PLEO|nr:hypothetical protein BDV95DRAFT_284671 [Massariosphaeria phaeospora]
MRTHSMSHPSPYDVGYGQPQSQSTGRKRSRPEDHHLPLNIQNPLDQASDPYGQPQGNLPVPHTPQGYSLQPYPPPAGPSSLPPTHHHHLPGPRPAKAPRMDESLTSPVQPHGPPSMVGADGMPAPAPRPRGPKLKFTGEDDQLLVDLKEKKNLTWKQIADFFPGRSSGTLQVRYCTKLKAKTTNWTDEMVQKLRNAMNEYETERWRIISSKVGNGFSPAACRDKAGELDVVEGEEEEQSGYTQTQMASGSSDPTAPYQ